MKLFRKQALLALLVPAALLAAGYLNAWASLDPCAEDAYREGRGRTGYDMRARPVELSRADVSARVVAPFVVEAGYLLPRDLHGVAYSRTYLVIGAHLRPLGSDEVRYVDASPPATNVAPRASAPAQARCGTCANAAGRRRALHAASARLRARWFDA